MIALDTNVLLRSANASDPRFSTVNAAIAALESVGETYCLFPQNVYEFWVVATRPVDVNGFGLSVIECEMKVGSLKQLFSLLLDPLNLLSEWEMLVVRYQCTGKVAHDARLVAAMRLHGVSKLLTFNTGDFARFSDLTVLDPATIATTAGGEQ